MKSNLNSEFVSNGQVVVDSTGRTIVIFNIGKDTFHINLSRISIQQRKLICRVFKISQSRYAKEEATRFVSQYNKRYGLIGKLKLKKNSKFLFGEINGHKTISFFMFGYFFIYNLEKFMLAIDKKAETILQRGNSMYKTLYNRFLAINRSCSINVDPNIDSASKIAYFADKLVDEAIVDF